MKLTRSRLTASLVSLTLGGAGLVAAIPAEAVTVTVPNFFYCSNQTGKCRQTNGPYVPSLPTACRWTFTPYWTGTSTRVCDYWR